MSYGKDKHEPVFSAKAAGLETLSGIRLVSK